MKRYPLAALCASLSLFCLLTLLPATALAQVPLKISVQAVVEDGGMPLNDASATLTFRLWTDATATGGSDLLWTETQTGLSVTGGLVSVMLGAVMSLEASFFTQPLWLGVSIGDQTATELAPRIELAAAPYALATVGSGGSGIQGIQNTDGTLAITNPNGPTASIDLNDGAVTGAKLASDAIMAGTGVTVTRDGSQNVVISATGGGGGSTGWALGGNGGTTAGTNFLGTTDDAPLEVKVNGNRVMRYEPETATEGPNVLGGWSGNSIATDVVGATIAGGGGSTSPNEVDANYGTVGGGRSNQANGEESTVGGGFGNGATGLNATVGGGFINSARGRSATISGGSANNVDGEFATVPGGSGNWAGGDNSFAAGAHAIVRNGLPNSAPGFYSGDADGDEGTFIWADTQTDVVNGVPGGFFSTGPDQFLIRAQGGVGIGTNAPTSQLTVMGDVEIDGTDTGLLFPDGTKQTTAAVGGAGSGQASFVGGGAGNVASAFLSAVVGGESSTASNNNSFVGGGSNNQASGVASTVPGGLSNVANGDFSFAAGLGASVGADHQRTFVWSGNPNADAFNRFASTGPDQFLINTGGGVGINTNAPGTILHVKQRSIDDGVRIEHDDDTDYWTTFIDNADDYNFAYNGALVAYIRDTNGEYVQVSDRRLKTEIRPLESTLSGVLALKPSRYRMQAAPEVAPTMGLIAQEVEAVFPEVVHEKDGIKGVAYAQLIPVLIQAMQEQQAQIEALKAEVARLQR